MNTRVNSDRFHHKHHVCHKFFLYSVHSILQNIFVHLHQHLFFLSHVYKFFCVHHMISNICEPLECHFSDYELSYFLILCFNIKNKIRNIGHYRSSTELSNTILID